MEKTSNCLIIIPAYNEEKAIGKVVRGCLRYCKKVIVVDDFSSDDTYNKAKRAGADDYCAKSSDFSPLIEAINALI